MPDMLAGIQQQARADGLAASRSFSSWDGNLRENNIWGLPPAMAGSLHYQMALSAQDGLGVIGAPELVLGAGLRAYGPRLFSGMYPDLPVSAPLGAEVRTLRNGNLEIGSSNRVTSLEIPSWSGFLEATPGRTTTVIGRFDPDMSAVLNQLRPGQSLDFGPKQGGFNVLNVPEELYAVQRGGFYELYNRPWLEQAIERDDIFAVATTPDIRNADGTLGSLVQRNSAGNLELTGFGKEYLDMRRGGFRYDAETKRMFRQR